MNKKSTNLNPIVLSYPWGILLLVTFSKQFDLASCLHNGNITGRTCGHPPVLLNGGLQPSLSETLQKLLITTSHS